jgi:hypothetical protein
MKQVIALVWVALALPVVAGAEAAPEPMAEPTAQSEAAPAVVAPELPVLEVLEAANVALADLRWLKRPVVVFADTPADPAFQMQMRLLEAAPEPLAERDVVVIIDTDPKAKTEVRQKLRPRGFSLVLMDKDGAVTLRKPLPWDVREITRAIDKMPLRREEILQYVAPTR